MLVLAFVDATATHMRELQQQVQKRPSSTPVMAAEPGDLVARALAILAHEAEASPAHVSLAPRSGR